jgi:hypothetical protein
MPCSLRRRQTPGLERAGLDLVGGDEGLVVGQRVDVDRLAVDVDQRDAAAAALSVMACVAEVSTAFTTIASTPEAMKFSIWLSCLPTSSSASSTWSSTPSSVPA